MKRRSLAIASVLLVLLFATMYVMTWMWPFLNRVETGETPEYPSLEPAYYRASPEPVFEAAREAISEGERWQLVRTERAEWRLEATHETRLVGFVDDVEIAVQPVTDEVTRVDLVSASRVGEWDFGQNARNVRDFFAKLDDRVGRERLDPDDIDG